MTRTRSLGLSGSETQHTSSPSGVNKATVWSVGGSRTLERSVRKLAKLSMLRASRQDTSSAISARLMDYGPRSPDAKREQGKGNKTCIQ